MNGSNPFAALGVEVVINAAGKMTALGGSAQTPAVANAQAAASRAHADIAQLRAAAGQRVARLAGAQAGCITPGAAAGVCVSVAAAITGTDLDSVARLPDVDGPRREVVLQAGHDVNFGAPVTQMIRLGGGRPVVVGTSERVADHEVSAALGPDTAAVLYVRSHHCLQRGRLSLAAMIDLARRAGVPVIVDAAAELDLRAYVSAGANLVTYSGGKAIGGPTVGFVVGDRLLIEACELQQRGIARAMKVGKEQIMGLIAALDAYPPEAGWRVVLDDLIDTLCRIPRLHVLRVPDRAGRDVERAGVRADGSWDVRALSAHLRDGRPSIRTRDHQLDDGLLLFDPRELEPSHVQVIGARVEAFFD